MFISTGFLEDIISVQPMSGPNSQIFYMNFVYGANKKPKIVKIGKPSPRTAWLSWKSLGFFKFRNAMCFISKKKRRKS